MPLSDYSSMEREIDEVPEPITLARGTEVKARIISVRSGISESEKNPGVAYFQVFYDVPNEPLAKEFNDFFWDIADIHKLGEKARLAAMRKFKNFASAIGLDYSRPFSWEDDLPGKTGWLIVGVRKSDEYGEQNTVQKYLAGGSGRPEPETPGSDEEVPF